jgi:phosphoserine phosphatase RsbU/P
MNRTPNSNAEAAVLESLRTNPTFAGVADETLDQIVALVAASSAKKISTSLRKVQLFEGISEEDALRLQQLADTVTLAAGEVLFNEGEKGETFYVVLRGRVELVKRGRDGVVQKLAVTREGEAFGEMAILNQTPRSATARAIEASQLLEISRDDFNQLLGSDTFAVRMLRGISKALWAMSVRFASNQGQGGDARAMVRSLSQVMQKSILPGGIPQVPGFSVMATTGASDKAEGESAWDCFRLGDGRFVFATLSAKCEGLPAGYPLVLARTLLRELGKDQLDLGRLLARVNEALVSASVAGASQRVECALVALQDGDLTWASAGPVTAAIVRAGGTVVDLPADAPALGLERGLPYRSIKVPLMPGDSFLSMARAAGGSLAKGKATVGENVGGEARDIVKKIAAALPGEDPITGDVFENTVLLLKCVDQAAAEASDGPSNGTILSAGPGLGGGPAVNA